MYLFREHRRIEILLALCETHFGSFEFSLGPSQFFRCSAQGVLCLLHSILSMQVSRETSSPKVSVTLIGITSLLIAWYD